MKNTDGLNKIDWARWMKGLGRNSRRIREFLGLSQEQLARLAGVSQGAISRLEAGRGLATPLLVVVRIQLAFQAALAKIDRSLLSEEAIRIIDLDHRLGLLPNAGEFIDVPIAKDPSVEEYLQTYRDLSERQRQTLLSVVRATGSALLNEADKRETGADAPGVRK
jgi:transcriptional regulator with XRE-family HTH domain